MIKQLSPLLQVLSKDKSIPISEKAASLWIQDIQNPLRAWIRPILQFLFAIQLHLIWFMKRLPLPQFSNHKLLQKLICWFCEYFVSYESNQLILRHFACESNILNFLKHNSGKESHQKIEPSQLYPTKVADMIQHSFVKHDQELFRMMQELEVPNENMETFNWENWHNVDELEIKIQKRWTQILDFETSHVLFMCLFCLLLKADEYRDAINGFQLDQSIAIRVGKIIADPSVEAYAYNKFPHYLVGPWNLTQRFLMHGFFTEYLNARLEQLRN